MEQEACDSLIEEALHFEGLSLCLRFIHKQGEHKTLRLRSVNAVKALSSHRQESKPIITAPPHGGLPFNFRQDCQVFKKYKTIESNQNLMSQIRDHTPKP
ncbi:hypothetical protein M670_04526 [Schinkia azotoformans MEV2011]|uniref:Uncharacterized protein n=1 Tax=Schinkia azotoformans MEV2011 TaxID=1348973 RepID=A0A072NF02_SCHAZ|nr:hypothetical protein M670_04526 [Schinkia azotoformans MEV2011]